MPVPPKVKSVRRSLFRVAGVMMLAGLGLVAWTHAQEAGTHDRIYVVCHVDTGPGTTPDGPSNVPIATKLLQQYVVQSRKDKRAVRIEAHVQIGRASHFSVVEAWQNQAAFEAHETAAHTKQFREEIQPPLGSPFDERLHQILK